MDIPYFDPLLPESFTRFTDGFFSGESDRSLILEVTYSMHR